MKTQSEIDKVRRGVSSLELAKLSLVFKALSDANRLTILKVLLERHNLCVSELAKLLHVSVPAASSHLRILERAGAVCRVRHGQSVCFELDNKSELFRVLSKVIVTYS